MSSGRRPTKCRTNKIGDVNIVKVIGRLTPDESDDILFRAVENLVEHGERSILLDLSAVTYINSTGVGSIIQGYRLLQNKGGDLKILNPSQCVSHIIQVSKLDSIFDVFHDQAAAIASFAEPSPEKLKAAEPTKRGRPRKHSEENDSRKNDEEKEE